jgi:hypothetical protein
MKNMKKLLTITLVALFAGSASAQENELKNFRFGLKVTPSVNWLKPEGKIIGKNGAVVKFGGGLITEFRLAKVASIQTGIQIDLDGGRVKYNNGGYNTPGANTVSYYYSNPDDNIVEYTSVSPSDSTGTYTHYQLNERTYKMTYITIPLMLKLKTKEIGTMTYFGQFGINSSFRWKAKANDELTVLKGTATGATESKSNIDITKDVSFYTAALNFGAGAEMNLSGSTSLLIGLNYNLGFTNAVKNNSDYLQKRTNTTSTTATFGPMPQSLKSNAIVLTVGVLF